MSNYNKHKIYRVRELTDAMGNTKFQVEAADSWLGGLFDLWTEYNKENTSLDEAIDHIKSLAAYRKKKDKIVYRKRVSEV
jgi:hypothetical protein